MRKLYQSLTPARVRQTIEKYMSVDAKAASSESELLRHETQMSLNRTFLGSLASVYFAITSGLTHPFLLIAFAYITYTIILATDIKIRKVSSARRRLLALLGDITIVSLALHAEPETNFVFFGVYLWFIFGNGFRFGIIPLFRAIAFTCVGFCLVIATTTFWSSHLFLSIGLLIVLAIPTSYCSTLILRILNAKLEAEEANKAKSNFLASISHELRTPLNAIIGSISLVEPLRLHPDDAENFAAVEVGAATLLGLIGHILDLSKIEANRVDIVEGEFEIAALLAEVRELTFVEGKRKGLGVSVFIAEDVPPVIRVDRRHLGDVLLNLASNAVKFTERGRVLIAVTTEHAPSGILRLRFEVRDTGIGISKAAQIRIFSSFTQEDSTVLDRFGGTGLGLAICKGLVKALHGEIGVISDKGTGSTFWFTIDCAKVALPEIARNELAGIIFGVSINPVSSRRISELSVSTGFTYEDIRCLSDAFYRIKERSLKSLNDVLLIQGASMHEAEFDTLARLDPYDRIPRILFEPSSDRERHSDHTQRYFDTVLSSTGNEHVLKRSLLVLSRCPISSPRKSLSYEISEQRGTGSHSTHILIADDNDTNRRVLVKTLERVGYRTTAVGDGKEALEAMRATSYDLVLMDLNMPIMNGLDATRAYRQAEPPGHHLQILAVTADATEEAKRACLDAGMDGCLTKPVVPVRLLQEIAAATRIVGDGRRESLPEATVQHLKVHSISNDQTVLDCDVFAHICSLGDNEFLVSLLDSFNADVELLINVISASATRSDWAGYIEALHKLLGASTNVGARTIATLARAGSRITTEKLSTEGNELVLKIEYEHARYRLASKAYIPSA